MAQGISDDNGSFRLSETGRSSDSVGLIPTSLSMRKQFVQGEITPHHHHPPPPQLSITRGMLTACLYLEESTRERVMVELLI